MPDFIAIKKLAGTDLGWFKSLYHRYSNSNLKGINLNTDILINEFYRDLPMIAAANGNRVPVSVTIFGPAQAPAYAATYKLVKSLGSKNWRLNGTLVADPIHEDGRFNILAPDDIIIMGFEGRPTPTNMILILLAAADPNDAPLHAAMTSLLGDGRQSMVSLDPADIMSLMNAPGLPSDNPLGLLLFDEDMQAALEDAVQGGLNGIRRLRGGRGMRRATREDVERASREMSRIGAEGEALVNGRLALQFDGADGWKYEWSSMADTYAPYDFRCVSGDGRVLFIDVKTTKQGPDEGFHMSLAEVICAAESDYPYEIYRVHELTEEGATLRISEDIREFAKLLFVAHETGMPEGVTADSFSIAMKAHGLIWGPPMSLYAGDIEGGY